LDFPVTHGIGPSRKDTVVVTSVTPVWLDIKYQC
jgi:hypothetical protein